MRFELCILPRRFSLREHGDILNPVFIDSLKPFTIAIDWWQPSAHPDCVFCETRAQVVANITVNQRHFMQEKYATIICNMLHNDLIKVGLSLSDSSDESFIKGSRNRMGIACYKGILTKQGIINLSGHGLKMLILTINV